MAAEYFDRGGPVMYALLGVWVVVLAGILDRLLYVLHRVRTRPLRAAAALAASGRRAAARACLDRVRREAGRGLQRIDALSQIATSLGLFGTVLGIARAFFARSGELGLAAPEVLAAGLATALFTTVAGLIVFLCGQFFLILWTEWLSYCERPLDRLLEEAPTP